MLEITRTTKKAVILIAGRYIADKHGARSALLTGMTLMSISSLVVPFMAR